MSAPASRQMASDLRVRILNVGQGDAIVGLLPDTPRAFVTDVYDAEPVLRLLEAEAIQEIVLYLSHSDRDHTRGAADLLTGFRGAFQGIFFNQDRWAQKPSTDYAKLLRVIAEVSRAVERTAPRSPRAALTTNLNTDPTYLAWFGPSVRVVVLHPTWSDLDSLATQGPNEVSGVLLIEHMIKAGVRRILLTADVQLTGISLLLERTNRQPVSADVLKFPHHGAWPEGHPGLSSIANVPQRTMADFLAAVAPRAVVVSAGFSNVHGHVKLSVFDALRDYHAMSGRLTEIKCTQFTSTCLRRRTLVPDFSLPYCAGDIEIRTGDSVSADGLTVSSVQAPHIDRIKGLVAAGGAPQCGFLPTGE